MLLQLVAPEVIVVIAALLRVDGRLIVYARRQDAHPVHRRRRNFLHWLRGRDPLDADCAPRQVNVFDGTLVLGPQTQLIQIALLILTILVILTSIESTFTAHVGEYLALILFAAASMMFLVSSENILLIFISLELLSLSLYVLAAFNKRSAKSAEAALKYFFFGGTSAAFTLFGLSLIYGLVRFNQSRRGSPKQPRVHPLIHSWLSQL